MDRQSTDPSTMADAAAAAVDLIEHGASSIDLWRHVVLQALDDYQSDVRLLSVEEARRGLELEPPRTGDMRIDAALAALAEHLARRDGWLPPAWSQCEDRYTRHWWFIDPQPGLQVCAIRESPLSFRKRGVFIGAGGLDRV